MRAGSAVRRGRGRVAEYHETITVLWMRLLEDVRARARRASWPRLRAYPALADKDLPLQYYSRDRLFSDEARAAWVEPIGALRVIASVRRRHGGSTTVCPDTRGNRLLIAGALVMRPPRLAGQLAPEPMQVMPAARAAAFVDAAARGLDYLPGEVVVKFKDGVSSVAAAARARRGAQPSLGRRARVGRRGRDPARSFAAGRQRPGGAARLAARSALRRAELHPPPRLDAERHRLRSAAVEPAGARHAEGLGHQSRRQCRLSSSPSSTPGSRPRTRPGRSRRGTARRSRPSPSPYATNPDLAASRLVSPMDFVTNGGSTVLDSDGHGTHVSSTVGEDTNNALLDARDRLQRAHHAGEGLHELLGRPVRVLGRRRARVRAVDFRRVPDVRGRRRHPVRGRQRRQGHQPEPRRQQSVGDRAGRDQLRRRQGRLRRDCGGQREAGGQPRPLSRRRTP